MVAAAALHRLCKSGLYTCRKPRRPVAQSQHPHLDRAQRFPFSADSERGGYCRRTGRLDGDGGTRRGEYESRVESGDREASTTWSPPPVPV
ncbi:unnamed protein product [Lampetra fluviatilis]